MHPALASAEVFFRTYLDQYFLGRDLEKTMAKLAPEFSVIGTGSDEWAHDRAAAEGLYARELKQAPEPLRYTLSEVYVRGLGEGVALVEASAQVTTQLAGLPWQADLRMTCVLVWCDAEWRLEHKHISIPARDLAEGESLPMAELEARNRRLESMVAERTAELTARAAELEAALSSIRTLNGLIPICAWCKQVRDDAGYWHQVEEYLAARTEVDFTHGMCPDCARQFMQRPEA